MSRRREILIQISVRRRVSITFIREFPRYITARTAGLAVGSTGTGALLYLLSVMANIPVLSGFR